MYENQELTFLISKVGDVNDPASITIKKTDLNKGTQKHRHPVREKRS